MARALRSEIKAVATALELPADSPEECAERVIAALDESRLGRKAYVFAVRIAGNTSLFGPYSTSHQAIKGAEKLHKGAVALDEGNGIYGLVSPTTLAEIDIDPRKCPDCQHPASAHGWPRSSTPGCVVALEPRGYVDGARRAGTINVCPCERMKF